MVKDMAEKSKSKILSDLLKNLEATTLDIEAFAVNSVNGLMIAEMANVI
jgi:predicted regulator of Ras-like GTPase activity (Roadblock/LC7/MglB family)